MTSIRKCKLTDNPSYILKNIRETLGIESSVVNMVKTLIKIGLEKNWFMYWKQKIHLKKYNL